MDRIRFGAAYYAEYQHRPDLEAGFELMVKAGWSWDEATASPSCTVTDILGGERHPPGEKVTLRAWDVRLFRSDEAVDQRSGAQARGPM